MFVCEIKKGIVMTLLGNIIWIVFGGFLIFLEYMLSGFALCLTIIGIPFGLQCFKLGILSLAPFGREVQPMTSSSGCLAVFMNVLWIIIGGIWICFTHISLAVLFAITIIGIPFAKQHLKLAALALLPFGQTIR